MGDRHPLQQLENGIHHQIRQQLAGDKHHARPRLPQPDELEQLAFLVVVRSLNKRHLLLAHIERRHHQHVPGVTPWSHQSDVWLQLALQILEGKPQNLNLEFSDKPGATTDLKPVCRRRPGRPDQNKVCSCSGGKSANRACSDKNKPQKHSPLNPRH